MKISTKGRYALRVMIELADNYSLGGFISIRDIATRQDISSKYLEQIISLLNKANFLDTARGNLGGYKLKRAPKEYRVGDILRATEGDLSPIYCLSDEGECDRREKCRTFEFWKGLDDVINDYVDSKTLEDFLADR